MIATSLITIRLSARCGKDLLSCALSEAIAADLDDAELGGPSAFGVSPNTGTSKRDVLSRLLLQY